MATDFGDDREIFDSGNAADDTLDIAGTETLAPPRTAEDTAVSDAIRQIGRGDQPAFPPAPQQRQPAPNGSTQPGDQPGGEEDRSTAGVLRALMDERDKRRTIEDRLKRYETQEQERTRQD